MPTDSEPRDGGVSVRAFEATDEPRVLEVLQAAFGKWPRGVDGVSASEFFRWKHTGSPFGASALLVAVADGTVVGTQAYMPWKIRAGERLFSTRRRVDLAVHPDFRRRGVSMAIRAAASFPDDVAFTWTNPNDQSRPGTGKAGLTSLERFPRFIQLRGPRSAVRWASRKRSRSSERPPLEAETAAKALADDALQPLLRSCASELDDRLATVKDLAYLRWRYGHFDEYRAVASDTGEGVGGLAIFRLGLHRGLWVLQVCELFVARDDHRTARRLLRQVRGAAQADFLSATFASRTDAAVCGFMQFPGESGLMTYALHENLVPDPTARESWAMSVGDLELL